jgi:hypothetical protein
MPYAFVQDLPTDWATYEKIVAELGLDGNAPDGLVAHAAGPTPDGVRVIDVWESEAAHQRFSAERLVPAREKVLGPSPVDAPPFQPLQVEHLVRG